MTSNIAKTIGDAAKNLADNLVNKYMISVGKKQVETCLSEVNQQNVLKNSLLKHMEETMEVAKKVK